MNLIMRETSQLFRDKEHSQQQQQQHDTKSSNSSADFTEFEHPSLERPEKAANDDSPSSSHTDDEASTFSSEFKLLKRRLFTKKRPQRHTPPTSDSCSDAVASIPQLPTHYPCLICQTGQHISLFSQIQLKKRIVYCKPAYCLKHYYGNAYLRIEAEAERMRVVRESQHGSMRAVNRGNLLAGW